MIMTENLTEFDDEPVGLIEPAPSPTPMGSIFEDLHDVAFKLRSYTESQENNDLGFGVELGMQRAAEMIENVIRRYQPEDQLIG